MTPETEAALRLAIDGRLPKMLSLIEKLCVQNSHTPNKVGGDVVGGYLESEARSLGMQTTRIASSRFADHWVFASSAAQASAKGAAVLVGHHDTVFPAGVFDVFERDGDLLRGPGVLDMKGGIVVMFEALRALRSVNLLDQLPIRVVIVGDEEVGSPEGKAVIESATDGARYALVFEAGRQADRIITRRKGTGSAIVTARGQAAHAANDHKNGVNAIWALARFIDRAQALTNYERGLTVNVGVISGGEAKNTVPDLARAEVDFRFETLEAGRELFQALTSAANEAAASVPKASIEVAGGIGRAPLERTAESAALMKAYAAEAAAVGLGAEEAALIAGGSDASTTSARGIPSIDGLGPRGKGFHTKNEQIEVSSLEPKSLALARLLARSLAEQSAPLPAK